MGVREMAQRLIALPAIAEDLSSVPSSSQLPITLVPGYLKPSFGLREHLNIHVIYSHRITHIHINKK